MHIFSKMPLCQGVDMAKGEDKQVLVIPAPKFEVGQAVKLKLSPRRYYVFNQNWVHNRGEWIYTCTYGLLQRDFLEKDLDFCEQVLEPADE